MTLHTPPRHLAAVPNDPAELTCDVCGHLDVGLHFHPSPRRARHYADRLPDDDPGADLFREEA